MRKREKVQCDPKGSPSKGGHGKQANVRAVFARQNRLEGVILRVGFVNGGSQRIAYGSKLCTTLGPTGNSASRGNLLRRYDPNDVGRAIRIGRRGQSRLGRGDEV